MARKKMHIRVIKEVLRLRFSTNLSIRLISQSINRSSGGVHNLTRKAERANLGWPVPKNIDDDKLEGMLYTEPGETSKRKAVPDWTSASLSKAGQQGNRSGKNTRATIPTAITAIRNSANCTASGTEKTQARDVKPGRNTLPTTSDIHCEGKQTEN